METRERNNKQTEGISAKSRMEHLIDPSTRAKFEAVLKAEHLLEVPRQFRDPKYFDEIPLYSRYSQLDFLKRNGKVEEGLLLSLALEYLQRVRSECFLERLQQFFALSIVSDDVSDPIVPHIFICNGNAKRRLKSLQLSLPLSGLGHQVCRLVRQVEHAAGYAVMEESSSVPDDVRVFVGCKSTRKGLIGLESLQRPAQV